jgi:hypothetical protein
MSKVWCTNYSSALVRPPAPSSSYHNPSPLPGVYRFNPPLWSNHLHTPGLTTTYHHSLQVHSSTMLQSPASSWSNHNTSPLSSSHCSTSLCGSPISYSCMLQQYVSPLSGAHSFTSLLCSDYYLSNVCLPWYIFKCSLVSPCPLGPPAFRSTWSDPTWCRSTWSDPADVGWPMNHGRISDVGRCRLSMSYGRFFPSAHPWIM